VEWTVPLAPKSHTEKGESEAMCVYTGIQGHMKQTLPFVASWKQDLPSVSVKGITKQDAKGKLQVALLITMSHCSQKKMLGMNARGCRPLRKLLVRRMMLMVLLCLPSVADCVLPETEPASATR
jgi:hypothetical protein